MIYGSVTGPVTRVQEKSLQVAVMKLVRWLISKTRRDRIWNETIREIAGVVKASKSVHKSRLRGLTI